MYYYDEVWRYSRTERLKNCKFYKVLKGRLTSSFAIHVYIPVTKFNFVKPFSTSTHEYSLYRTSKTFSGTWNRNFNLHVFSNDLLFILLIRVLFWDKRSSSNMLIWEDLRTYCATKWHGTSKTDQETMTFADWFSTQQEPPSTIRWVAADKWLHSAKNHILHSQRKKLTKKRTCTVKKNHE